MLISDLQTCYVLCYDYNIDSCTSRKNYILKFHNVNYVYYYCHSVSLPIFAFAGNILGKACEKNV